MTPRANLLGLYRKQGYENAPVGFCLCPALQEKYKEVAGDMLMSEYFDYPAGFAERGVPVLHLRPRDPVDWTVYFDTPMKKGTTFDDYGVAHEPGSEAAKHMTYMRHPLAKATSLEELQSYPFPELDCDGLEDMRSAVEKIHADGLAATGGMECTIWETAWYIRDMTMLMMDMAMEDQKATFLLDKITEHACQRATAFASAGVDIIKLGDDIGMQSTMMMSKEMYDDWLKPRLTQVICAAKAQNPNVLIQYHTCGFVEPLIESLIDAGVEILNPVQPECMEFSAIHKKYGDKLSFNGTLGTQTTMPFGTPKEVQQVVLRNLELAGPAGGLFCCPTHILEPEVPWENVEAYVAACKEFSSAGR